MTRMDAFKGDKAKFLPKRTFKDKMTLCSGKGRVAGCCDTFRLLKP